MTQDSHSIDIAKTIIQQIQYADKWFLPAIAAKNFLALPESILFQGGLRFNCNGLKHKGVVEISLRWVDDYTITFLSKTGVEIKSVECVYCDMLIDVLNWIEGL